MTKEEYERLLKSDYWKGYSYSLIKERDFTCEDCGRRFYNQRNKLQVHHLVYRDVNPWSYNPDEVVVLCEECHKKRHGLAFEPQQSTSYSQKPFDEYDKGCTYSSDKESERVFFSRNSDRSESSSSNYPYEPEPRNGFKFKYVLYGVLLFVCILMGRGLFNNQMPLTSNKLSYENNSHSTDDVKSEIYDETKDALTERTKPSKEMKAPSKMDRFFSEETAVSDVHVRSAAMETEREVPGEANEVEVKKKPSRELNTLDLLERINHAEVVKQAKQAGVSTAGSTTDILERINHAEVTKQAKQAGVSTAGSTTDILERINHAEVVKQAKQAGVSTEGSTTEILERITRKEMEKYNF